MPTETNGRALGVQQLRQISATCKIQIKCSACSGDRHRTSATASFRQEWLLYIVLDGIADCRLFQPGLQHRSVLELLQKLLYNEIRAIIHVPWKTMHLQSWISEVVRSATNSAHSFLWSRNGRGVAICACLPFKLLHRERATYIISRSNALDKSTSTRVNVIPCDLWTVIAHAGIKGICSH